MTVVKDTVPANAGADQFDFTTTGQADYKLDTDGDGEVDVTMVDLDQDGNPDKVVDGDGGHAPA